MTPSSSSKGFSPEEYWKAIVLFGRNNATYKMALGKCLLKFAENDKTTVPWDELSTSFLSIYRKRLMENPMPQQGHPSRLTVLERIVSQMNLGVITEDEAIGKIRHEGFKEVIPRFQKIGGNSEIVAGLFYDFNFGRSLTLHDNLLEMAKGLSSELDAEISAKWSLLEGAFSISHAQEKYTLANDLREIYLQTGYERTPLTHNIPFLQGYQGNVCFYCGEILTSNIHVDHLLPRQVVHHDDVWNLVLSHAECNMQKSDKLVGPHFIEKLIARNENIMGSNHPWKAKIESQLGVKPIRRARSLKEHYANVRAILGDNFWGGTRGYNPASDPFYRRLITKLNNDQKNVLR